MISVTEYAPLVLAIGHSVEFVGVIVIVVGFMYATMRVIRSYFGRSDEALLVTYRRQLGRAMMLGLEFLVAGDIISTVLVEHSIEDVLSLGLIVLIRTILVFTIHLEVEGRWPWQGIARDN